MADGGSEVLEGAGDGIRRLRNRRSTCVFHRRNGSLVVRSNDLGDDVRMRRSPDRYPEYVNFYCSPCNTDNDDVKVDSIEDESVLAFCPECGEPTYVKVVD